MSVSGFMGYLKGKSSLIISQKWGGEYEVCIPKPRILVQWGIMWTLSHIFMDTQLLIIAFLRIRTLDKLFEATIALVNFRICN